MIDSNSVLLRKQVEIALDELRPAIRGDGGDIELVNIENGIVSIRFLGACVQCPIAAVTLKLGIEETLLQKVPEIKQVVAVE